MAKRHSTQSIPAFPEHIDRQRFGDWLSGFTAGEGCFHLSDRQLQAMFVIKLRDDDAAILQTIQSFFQCGTIYRVSKPSNKARLRCDEKPCVALNVSNFYDLATFVVPHFDAYPLHAKKARDFAIWREAVLLAGPISRRHSQTKWKREERLRFVELAALLKNQRKYSAPILEIPEMIAGDEPNLFDGIL